MENAPNILETTKGLHRNQRLILQSLYTSPHSIKIFSFNKNTILNLQAKGLVELKNEQVSLTSLGQAICDLWQEKGSKISDSSSEPEKGEAQKSSKSAKLSQEKLEKSNQFLDLYKQGLSYQDIGDKYGLSRERVRQILNVNPVFNEYVEERDKAKAIAEAGAEREKEERAKQQLYLRSLAILYPERVAELWDYEKNREVKPETIIAGSTSQYIWLKCPIDEHSWKKNQMILLQAGIEVVQVDAQCVQAKKKPEKQRSLIEVYPELVSQYWNYEKNTEVGLEPVKLTLGSNRKAWFRCPIDCNEWQAIIASTVTAVVTG